MLINIYYILLKGIIYLMFFLSNGFRPFFFAAMVFAAIIIPIWVLIFDDLIYLALPMPNILWHSHEMIFGFIIAAAAGFILTAIPNWTGNKPLRGYWLGMLFILWLAGRFSMLFYLMLPFGFAAATDIAFLVILNLFIAWQLIISNNYKNLIICLIFLIFIAANILMHLEFLNISQFLLISSQRLGVDSVALLIVVIGGRVVPAFTGNWLNANGYNVKINTGKKIDLMAMIAVLILLIFNIFMPGSNLTYLVALIAALVNLYRLSKWHSMKTLPNPLLWVLHLGYLWLCLGLFLEAGMVFDNYISESLNFHAIGIGAAGTMIAAIMTRASLGHSGRKLLAPKGIALAYILISISSITRIAAEIYDFIDHIYLLNITALLWSSAFAIIAIIYAPILLFKNK